MDIGSAFTYMFDDEEWLKKLAIGGGIILGGFILLPVLLVGLALFLPVAGYMLETLKRVRDGQPTPLPEWDDLGSLFQTGLMVAAIGLVYNIPSILLSCASIPTNPQMATEVMGLDRDTANVLGLVGACIGCLQFLVGLAAGFIMPAAFIRYAQYGTFGSAFQFGELFSFISNNIGDYIITVVITWVAGLIAFFGIILCGIGFFFTSFWAQLVSANLYGQLARKAGGAGNAAAW
jgi:hypothetical protein